MRKVRNHIGEKATLSLLLLLIGLVALTTAVYAWIGVSRVPFITNMSLSILTENGIMIGPADETQENSVPSEDSWSTYWDASEYFSDMVPIRPATFYDDGLGNLFHMITYDLTGRTSGVQPLTEENFNQTYTDNPDYSRVFQDQVEGGYMCYVDLWMKTNEVAADIYLADGELDGDGQLTGGTYCVGEPTWDEEQGIHVDAGGGLECSIRFLFEWQSTDVNGNPVLGSEKHYIMYEPNCDLHPLEGSEDGYIATENVAGEPLISEDCLITQNAYVWQDLETPLIDTVSYTAGEFVNNPKLLSLPKSGMVKLRVYVWIEGQDVDCKAYAAANEVNLLASFSFAAKETETIDTGIERRDVSELTEITGE